MFYLKSQRPIYRKIFSGFTLVELLIVISVIAILFSAGLAAYNEFNRNQMISQAAKTLRNDLRLVQSKALSAEKACGSGANLCGGTDAICGNETAEKPLVGWFVSFGSTSYTFYGLCGSTQFDSKTISLPANVTLATNLGATPLLGFLSLGKGVSMSSTGDAVLTLTAFGKSQGVTVSRTGDIK